MKEDQESADDLSKLVQSHGALKPGSGLLSGVVASQLEQFDPAREAFKKAQARGAEGADAWLKSVAQR